LSQSSSTADPHSDFPGSAHDHGSSRGGSRRAMVAAFFLTASFMVAELVGGLLANSLALVADAGHMVSDAAALGLGLIAIGERLVDQPPVPDPATLRRAA